MKMMTENQIQPIFQLCSYLLSYPNEAFLLSLEEVEAELNALNAPFLQKKSLNFVRRQKVSH